MEHHLIYDEFRNALKLGNLSGLRCRDCGQAVIPPKMACHNCQSLNLEPAQFTKTGTIYTFTVIRTAPSGFSPPYVVALVRLKDGPMLMGIVENVDAEQASMENLMGREVKVGCAGLAGERFGRENHSVAFNLVNG